MKAEARIAAFEGGQLRFLGSGASSREVVLALPLNRLLVKMVRVPPEEDPVACSAPVLKAISPFPDEELTVACELVREDEGGKVVIAAALPESSADDIGEALDAAKLNIVKIDALVFGQLRGVWPSLGESQGRRLVAVDSPDCLTLVVLDGDQPTSLRAITDRSELRREVMLSLLEAEDFGGAKKLDEIFLVSSDSDDPVAPSPQVSQDPLASQLSFFAPVRSLKVGSDAALVGIGERAADDSTLDALPASWREVLEESRFKAKLTKYLAVAGGVWLLAMGVLFGVPVVYGFMTDHQKSLSKQHHRQYKEVNEMRQKVQLIQKYSDHARGALEIMKALSDRLPGEITLSGWDYKRDDGVRVKGEADTAEAVYKFKDAMDALSAGEGEDARPIFAEVELGGPNASKGRYVFTLECRFEKRDEG